MKDERYKKIMADLGFPNMTSLLVALQQVANEAGQECAADEREACAGICDEIANVTDPDDFALDAVNEAARVIRERSNVKVRGRPLLGDPS